MRMWRSEVNAEQPSLWLCILHLTLTEPGAHRGGGSGSPASVLPGLRLQTHAAAFPMGSCGPNSGPHAFKTHSPSTEPSPKPPFVQSAVPKLQDVCHSADSHRSLQSLYFEYTITLESQDPRLSLVPPLPHFTLLLGLLYRCLSHLGTSPAGNPINSELSSVFPTHPPCFLQGH